MRYILVVHNRDGIEYVKTFAHSGEFVAHANVWISRIGANSFVTNGDISSIETSGNLVFHNSESGISITLTTES